VTIDAGLALDETDALVESIGGRPRGPGCEVDRPRTALVCIADRFSGEALTNSAATGRLVDDDVLDPCSDPRRDPKDSYRECPDDCSAERLAREQEGCGRRFHDLSKVLGGHARGRGRELRQEAVQRVQELALDAKRSLDPDFLVVLHVGQETMASPRVTVNPFGETSSSNTTTIFW